VGPSHDDGGIPAIVDGTEPIEVEGGEFIINKQTVDAVGEEFLHKLNSTETTHHTGGFNEGVLPSPSKFKDGGKVNRRTNMSRKVRHPQKRTQPTPRRRMDRGGIAGRGRTITTRRLAKGGRINGVRKMGHGGTAHNNNCGGPGQMPCVGQMAVGGVTGGIRKQCSMLVSGVDCKNTKGCSWNYSTGMCH